MAPFDTSCTTSHQSTTVSIALCLVPYLRCLTLKHIVTLKSSQGYSPCEFVTIWKSLKSNLQTQSCPLVHFRWPNPTQPNPIQLTAELSAVNGSIVTMVVFCTVSEIKRDIGRKTPIFHSPLYFTQVKYKGEWKIGEWKKGMLECRLCLFNMTSEHRREKAPPTAEI